MVTTLQGILEPVTIFEWIKNIEIGFLKTFTTI